MQAMTEFPALSRGSFEADVLPAYEPVVLRGLVAGWPLVAAGLQGMESALHYLADFDVGASVDALLARPDALRAFGHAPDLDGFNFLRDRRPLAALLEQFRRYGQFPEPPSLAVQSALVPEALPGLEEVNVMPLLDGSTAPRLWLGNRSTTPAHFDSSHNIACVVAGRRRFTLLPPQSAPDLYLCAPDQAPASAPMSVAHLHAPDFDRFPRLRNALAVSRVAELAPGDAIYIPPLWFHQVESLDPQFNGLMNYWWRPAPAPGREDDAQQAALRLSMLAFRHLPDGEREGWLALLAHYAFGARPQALGHLPPDRRGLLGDITAAQDAAYRVDLIARLK
jgi:Cupin-like domain